MAEALRRPLRLVVVEDTASYRDWLLASLSQHPDTVTVIGEADNAREAIRLIEVLNPDVVLLDLQLPWLRWDGTGSPENGIAVIERVRGRRPRPRLLVLSGLLGGEADLYRALKAGADGCMYKNDIGGDDLIANVCKVAAGQAVFTSRIAQLMLDDYLQAHARRLQPEERAVLAALGEGSSDDEIDIRHGQPLGTSGSAAADLLKRLRSSELPPFEVAPEKVGTPVSVFISYSHRDESLRRALNDHLSVLRRQGVIRTWHDREIGAGSEWAGQIDQHLNEADVLLLLASSSFLASDYCYDKEMTRALERDEAGEARVIPIILRPVDWKDAPFARLQVLPRDGRPITKWTNRDEAWSDVAKGIREAVTELWTTR